MKLVVLGSPRLASSPIAQQKTVVTYDPCKEITTVDCDVDIVTLGLTVNVLTEQYEQYLAQLDNDVAEKIRCTTRKAVKAYGSD